MKNNVYFRIVFLFVMIFFFYFLSNCFLKNDRAIKLTENAIDKSAGNVPCYKIETPTATYFLEKEGVGLSSMIDKDGNDWISFHKKEGSRAGGEYRGFPNAVHKQDGNFFHPKNQNTDLSTTKVEYNGPERVTISGFSGNKNWACLWDFYPTHCTFTMTKMAPERKYWILYEGTPGGKYDDTDWWTTSAGKEKLPLTTIHEGDIPAPEWIVFGDKDLERIIFLLHHEDDDHIDRFYQMEKEMTVFGFGRKGLAKFIDKVPQSFSIGFIESTDHKTISQIMEKLLMGQD